MIFVKIFQTIYDSSIADDWKTRVVFQDLLTLADRNGVVDMTIAAIHRRTNLPLEMILEAIPKLEGPDPTSRSPVKEGRRIERLDAHRDWGWTIVNYQKYRESVNKEMLRVGEAERKAAYRRKQRNSRPPPVPPPNLREEDIDIEGEQSGTKRHCPGQSRTVPDISHILAWLQDTNANGSDYSELEARSAFLALKAGGWQWGKREIIDWRSAIERQIQTDRKYGPNKNTSRNSTKDTSRNAGTLNEGRASQYRGVGRVVRVSNPE